MEMEVEEHSISKSFLKHYLRPEKKKQFSSTVIGGTVKYDHCETVLEVLEN